MRGAARLGCVRVVELGPEEPVHLGQPVVVACAAPAPFWAIELVRDRATREPWAPYGQSSPEMMAILSSCTRRGLLPFANFNRIHVVPPLTISDDKALTGPAILGEALTEARPNGGSSA